MLKVFDSMKGLKFSALMDVYIEGNRENGEENYPELPANLQLLRAEEEFYQYLQQVFFATPGALYAVWEEAGHYCAALRLEPYMDGVLLTALETLPTLRRKGYASMLMNQTVQYLCCEGPVKLYSHVSKRNTASLHTHFSCGFEIIKEHAVYLDGAVNRNAYTLCLHMEKHGA